jgi:hypothetical protein
LTFRQNLRSGIRRCPSTPENTVLTNLEQRFISTAPALNELRHAPATLWPGFGQRIRNSVNALTKRAPATAGQLDDELVEARKPCPEQAFN